MRLAVAIWGDRISPVFDVSRRFLVMDIEKCKVVGERVEIFTNDNPTHKLSKLSQLKVNTLICGAISLPIADMLNQHGIHIIPFITGDKQRVVAAFLGGTLPNSDLSMPGWRGRRRVWKPVGGANRGGDEKTVQEDNLGRIPKEEKAMPNRDGTGPDGHGPRSGQRSKFNKGDHHGDPKANGKRQDGRKAGQGYRKRAGGKKQASAE